MENSKSGKISLKNLMNCSIWSSCYQGSVIERPFTFDNQIQTMLSLHTNVASLSAQDSLGRTQTSLSTSMTRLSTGYRINSAMDDAAGLQIATRLKAQSSGMSVAMRNTQNSISMLQTADGALNEVNNILTRMKDLATQAADGSSSAWRQLPSSPVARPRRGRRRPLSWRAATRAWPRARPSPCP